MARGTAAAMLGRSSERGLLQAGAIICDKKACALAQSKVSAALDEAELLQDNNFRADLDPVIKVGNVLVGHADAPG
jgi:hypothetical protein